MNEKPQKDEEGDSKASLSPTNDQTIEMGGKPALSTAKEATESVINPPQWTSDSNSQDSLRQMGPFVSDKDESAVAGLLALGGSMQEPLPALRLPEFALSPGSKDSGGQIITPSASIFPNSRADFSPGKPPSISGPSVDVSQATEALVYMRNYRYNVAPWVRTF